jgi:hypothetical protein
LFLKFSGPRYHVLGNHDLDSLSKVDLKPTRKPVIAFVHQLLDCEGDLCVNNAKEARSILKRSGKTLAVFQDHNHGGHYSRLARIHYYTLKAMLEGSGSHNNAYAVVEIHEDGTISITGYRKAISKQLS